MAAKLNIPWCAVSDEDALPDGTIKPNTKAAREKLSKLAGDRDCQVSWSGDLEACFGLKTAKAEPKWQVENVELLDHSTLNATHPNFAAAGEQVRNWISAN